MKKLFLMFGVVALLASCSSTSTKTNEQELDSTEVVLDSEVQILDVDSTLAINQNSID